MTRHPKKRSLATWEMALNILREDGVRGFWRGGRVHMTSIGIGGYLYIRMYEAVRRDVGRAVREALD